MKEKQKMTNRSDKNKKRINKKAKKSKKKQVSYKQGEQFSEKINMIPATEFYYSFTENNLTESNYWKTIYNKNGVWAMLISNGCFSLLIPEDKEQFIDEMRTGECCIITQGKLKQFESNYFELLFEDNTDFPFHITISSKVVMPLLPSKENEGQKFTIKGITKGCNKVFEMDAYYRRDYTHYLPNLQKWNGRK